MQGPVAFLVCPCLSSWCFYVLLGKTAGSLKDTMMRLMRLDV